MKPAALVTGAARRLGRQIALHLASNGYDIALHYNTSEGEAKKTAAEITALGARCEILKADLADTAVYETLVSKAHKAFPGLSALVNSASIFERAPLMESDAALYEKEMTVNLQAPVFLTQAFARTVKQGCVVNLLDANVTTYNHPYFFYLLSKKALLEFTRMAAAQLGPAIRVNGVCPGFTLPPEGWDKTFQAKLEARLPLKKIATPEDIAQAVHLLIHTQSLTGQVLFVDGGESLL